MKFPYSLFHMPFSAQEAACPGLFLFFILSKSGGQAKGTCRWILRRRQFLFCRKREPQVFCYLSSLELGRKQPCLCCETTEKTPPPTSPAGRPELSILLLDEQSALNASPLQQQMKRQSFQLWRGNLGQPERHLCRPASGVLQQKSQAPLWYRKNGIY